MLSAEGRQLTFGSSSGRDIKCIRLQQPGIVRITFFHPFFPIPLRCCPLAVCWSTATSTPPSAGGGCLKIAAASAFGKGQPTALDRQLPSFLYHIAPGVYFFLP